MQRCDKKINLDGKDKIATDSEDINIDISTYSHSESEYGFIKIKKYNNS